MYYCIDLDSPDYWDDEADVEKPHNFYAVGPFMSYREAQDYGNRHYSFFGVAELL